MNRKSIPLIRPAEVHPASPEIGQLHEPTVADTVLSALSREGVDYVFGVPGSALTPMYESLSNRKGPQHILARHEGGAAFMAVGYARVSGMLGVCMTTTGPGATNAITGVAAGRTDSVPMLVLTGQSATKGFGKNPLQDSTQFGVDTVGLFSHVTKLSTIVPSPDRASEMVEMAIRTAVTGRPGPVHLSLPVDVQKQHVHPLHRPGPRHVQSRPYDPVATVEAARVLSGARKPAILAGHGVAVSGAANELLEVATAYGIPVATTPKGKGVFPESHPLSLGVFGFGGHLKAEAYLLGADIDVLLVLGSSLGELQTNNWDERLAPRRALIHVDIDPQEIGRNYAVDVGIVGDIRAVLQALAERHRTKHARNGPASAERPRPQGPTILGDHANDPPDALLKPPRLVHELRQILPDDGLLFVDNGNSIIWAAHYFEARLPGTFFLSLGLASMGAGVTAAIGGKLAAPNRPVVSLTGDAAFAMNGMEVHTAVEYGLPVIWVVLNNGGHGMVYHGERMLYGHDLKANRYQHPIDFKTLAESIGALGLQANTPRTFRAAFEKALAADRPTVIDATIDPEEVPEPLLHRARAVARSMDNQPLSRRSPWLT